MQTFRANVKIVLDFRKASRDIMMPADNSAKDSLVAAQKTIDHLDDDRAGTFFHQLFPKIMMNVNFETSKVTLFLIFKTK